MGRTGRCRAEGQGASHPHADSLALLRRELARHGGILCDFLETWSKRQVFNVQYGVGERGPKSVVTGEPVAGAEVHAEGSGGSKVLTDAEGQKKLAKSHPSSWAEKK